jgi:hypothetical protein
MTGASTPLRSNRPQWLALHPTVYRLLIGSVAALFVAVWIPFSHSDYAALQLAVVALFLVMFVGVPWVMARFSRAERPDRTTFGEWRSGDLDIHTGPIAAGEAALMIMIAPAAVLLGVAVISTIAYLAAVGAI